MLERDILKNIAVLSFLFSSACGGKVVFDNGAGGTGGSGSVGATAGSSTSQVATPTATSTGSIPNDLSKACVDADQAIDWSDCPDQLVDSRVTRSYCTSTILTSGCQNEVASYYECLAQHPSSCVETASQGSFQFVIHSDGCLDEEQVVDGCVSSCVGGSTCVSSTTCTCNPGTENTGAACCWYPSCPADNSVPNCFALGL